VPASIHGFRRPHRDRRAVAQRADERVGDDVADARDHQQQADVGDAQTEIA
jgi:hypothetical protein